MSFQTTAEPLLSRYPRADGKWSLNRGSLLKRSLSLTGIRRGLKSLFGNKHACRFVTTDAHNREQQNDGKAVVRGKRINRGGGYGMEDPWKCHFAGDKFSIRWLDLKLGNERYVFKQT